MRALSTTLISAQNFKQTINGESGKRVPYVELIFHAKDGSTIDYSERQKGIEHHEMLYDGRATILLRNNDHIVEDLIGSWIEIVYGDYFFIDAGTIYSQEGHPTARLWVESQMDISFPGTKMVVLELHDGWKLLADKPCIIDEQNDLAPYHWVKWEDIFTPFYIMTLCLNSAGFDMLILTEDDGFIDTFLSHAFFINEHYSTTVVSHGYRGKYESTKDVILRALSYTQSYLRQRGGYDKPVFRVVYPEPVKGEREADETYYSYKAHWFNEFIYRKNVVSPNQVLTYCDYNFEDWDFNNPDNILIGQARDQDSIDKYAHTGVLGDGIVLHIEWCPDITDQGNADSVAQAILSRQIVASRGGRLIIPHDIRVELLDLVEVYDAR